MNELKDLHQAFSPEVMAALANTGGRRHQRSNGAVADPSELHCFDAWWIARCKPNSHGSAKHALMREGFEVWYPQGRLLSRMPDRYVGPKKRKQKQLVLREGVRTPYGDYLFLRRLFGSFSLMRLFDLNGLYGICLTGEVAATILDYEIEMLRLAEYDGKFDRCDVTVTAKQLRLAEIRKTKPADDRGISEPITHTILESTRQTLLFVESFGRITRVVAGEGDLHHPNTLTR
jgi:hypothetical protein